MALTHFTMSVRTRIGHNSGRRAVEYLTRSGEYVPAKDAVQYLTRESDGTQKRGDLVYKDVGNLPDWAGNDAAVFFDTSATFERMNGRWAVSLQFALPNELSHDQNVALLHDFVGTHLPRHPYVAVIHSPCTTAGEHQIHAHVLFSERTLDGIARGPHHFFKRANREQPARGGAAKDLWWHEKSAPRRLRQSYCDIANVHLERSGSDQRLDPRSLYSRGIEREPEQVAGWRGVAGAEQRQQAQEARHRTREKEEALAREHWEQRKAVLGIGQVHDLASASLQTISRAWTRESAPIGQARPPRSLEDLHLQIATLTATVAEHEQVAAQLRAVVRTAQYHEQTHTIPPWSHVKQTAEVLEHAVSIGLIDDDGQQKGATLKRGWDKNREHGRSLQR